MKSTKRHRTIVDVTQLVHRSGALSGIPRVMNELGVRFYELDEEVIFVSWVKEVRAYCEIDFALTMANRGNLIAYLKNGQDAPVRDQKIVSATAHIGGKTTASKDMQAQRSASLLKKAAKRGLIIMQRLLPAVATRLESQAIKLKVASYKKVRFKPGDAVFIGWGEWWDAGFINMLQQARKESKVDIIQVIHDLGPITSSQFSWKSGIGLVEYCQAILPISSLVLVVSKHGEKELKDWLKQQKLHEPPIRVFRNGDDFAFAKSRKPSAESFKLSGLKGGDFVLAHGTVEIRKNHLLYYYVYKLAKSRGIKLPKLLISGRLGWSTQLGDGIEPLYEIITRDEEVNKDILFIGGVTDEELSWLFDNAMFSMYVSFYEGWGVPVAESLARGTPCITANVGSMLEIADDIVYYSSPASTDDLLEKMLFLTKPNNLAAARKRTKKYKLTSWDDSFRQINQHIKEVIK